MSMLSLGNKSLDEWSLEEIIAGLAELLAVTKSIACG